MLQVLGVQEAAVQLSQALEPPAVIEKMGRNLPPHFSHRSSGSSRLVMLTRSSTTSPQSSHLYSYSGIRWMSPAQREYPAGAATIAPAALLFAAFLGLGAIFGSLGGAGRFSGFGRLALFRFQNLGRLLV